MNNEYLKLLDFANVSILIVDASGKILHCNQLFLEFTGLDCDQCVNHNVADILPLEEDEMTSLMRAVQEAISTGTPSPEMSIICPIRIHNAPVSKIQNIIPLFHVQDKPVSAAVVVELVSESSISISEITEGLQKTEKIMALGDLMAGLAHEIKTPLGSIISNTDVIVRCINKLKKLIHEDSVQDLPEAVSTSMESHINMISGSIQVNELASRQLLHQVNSLKHFLRFDEETYQQVNLIKIVEQVLVLTHHLTKNKISIKSNFGPIPLVNGSPGKISQVFLNIITNAVQAMDDAGEIVISTLTRDENAVIQISDTGHGISKENLRRIFQPGFTTKKRGLGTGLGLAISLKIVQEHGGTIEVVSDTGKGSTFSITLPAGELTDTQVSPA